MSGSLVMTVYSDGAPRQRARGAGAIRARYDNALTHDENKRNWWGADYLSAKAANSFQVRRQLRIRSRYEVSNNPYLFGICNGNADDLVDTGPTLQVKTGSAKYNRAVERAWAAWCDEVELVEKLRTCKLAKSVDGEGFLVLKTVAELDHPVKLFPVDVEADQVTNPAPSDLGQLWVDGLTLHPVTGRPVWFHVLRHHPGDYFFPDFNPLAVDKVHARHVIHWFGKFRPGQVRGVPVFTPSLDLFAELRAFRRAVLGGAELAADFAAVIQQPEATGAFADEDADQEYEAFKKVPVERRMMTMLPPGATMAQFDPKQPSTSYEQFQEKCLAEAIRPLAYPLNLALGSSQKFNFSSAKLDHVNYRGSLRVERTDCERVVLKRLFRAWYTEAVLAGAIPAFEDVDTPPPHEWHWPGFEPLDAVVDAQADQLRLAGGTELWRDFWARRGYDWREVMAQQAAEKDEIERLGLQFGQPANKTITEQDDTGDEGAGPKKAAPKADGSRGGRRIRAVKDANGQEHDEDGKFGKGGGGGGKSPAKPQPVEIAAHDHASDFARRALRAAAHGDKEAVAKLADRAVKGIRRSYADEWKHIEHSVRSKYGDKAADDPGMKDVKAALTGGYRRALDSVNEIQSSLEYAAEHKADVGHRSARRANVNEELSELRRHQTEAADRAYDRLALVIARHRKGDAKAMALGLRLRSAPDVEAVHVA